MSVAKVFGQDLGLLRESDLLAAPTELPTTPSTFWLEVPGFYVRISPPNLFANDVLNAYGQIYASYAVNA